LVSVAALAKDRERRRVDIADLDNAGIGELAHVTR
jgi:hypothetical protein